MKSPAGTIEILANDKAITGITFVPRAKKDNPNSLTDLAEKQLSQYFAKERKTFDLPIELHGTNFQMSVWKELQKIPFGKALSYGDVARKLRNPKAGRAVGSANGKNPISIVVPCHRVIASDGSLGGYTGGLDKKRALLALEKIPYKIYRE